MIVNEKSMNSLYPPPPPYTQIASTWPAAEPQHSPETSLSRSNTVLTTSVTTSPSLTLSHPSTFRSSTRTGPASLSSLPSHILLQIVYTTFPQTDGLYEGESKAERQRENLFWLETSLRLVNRALYTACMHILRSTYLPAYDKFVRRPYTSDPFPSSVFGSTSITSTTYRELRVLDQFIALLAFEDVLLDSSSLVLPREEAYKDLFELLQPKSRLEDLVREEGLKRHLVWVDDEDHLEPPSVPLPVEPVVEMSAGSVVTTSDGTVILHPPSRTSSPPSSPAPSPTTATHPTEPCPDSASPTRSSFSSFMSSAKAKAKKRLSRPKTPLKNTASLSPSPYPYPHPDTPTNDANTNTRPSRITPIPFSTLSVSFNPRKAALLYTPESAASSNWNAPGAAFNGSAYGSLSLSAVSHGRYKTRTLLEVGRNRDDRLEETARRIARELRDVMQEEVE